MTTGMGIPWKGEGRGRGRRGGRKSRFPYIRTSNNNSRVTANPPNEVVCTSQVHNASHSLVHTQPHVLQQPASTDEHPLRLTPAKGRVDVQPHPLVGPKHLHQEVVDDHSLTEHPGEDGEKQVVEEGSHEGTGDLGEGGGGGA